MVAVGRGSGKPRVLARGFRTPLGLTWVGRTLYVSARGSVSRLALTGKRVTSRRQILSELPFGRHQQDTVALGPDGRLYLGSGSTCDVCREQDKRSGAILSFKLDGSDYPLGLAVEPGGGLLVGDWGRGVVYRLRKR